MVAPSPALESDRSVLPNGSNSLWAADLIDCLLGGGARVAVHAAKELIARTVL